MEPKEMTVLLELSWANGPYFSLRSSISSAHFHWQPFVTGFKSVPRGRASGFPERPPPFK